MNAIIPGTNYSIHDDGAVFNTKTLRFIKPQSNIIRLLFLLMEKNISILYIVS